MSRQKTDADFARFPGLKWLNPLEKQGQRAAKVCRPVNLLI